MRLSLPRDWAIAAFFSVAVFGPLFWFLLDRDPPHTREAGEIVSATPADCRLPDDAPSGAIFPGGCAEVKWKIRVTRICPPSSQFNVTRIIKTPERQFIIGQAISLLNEQARETGSLSRFIILPVTLPYGPASYYAKACFACNPLQRLWPVCVDQPDIHFDIAKPMGATFDNR